MMSVVDQTEAAILAEIRAGRWREKLPSFTVLAGMFGVSVPTVGLAVARLARAGALVSRGKRRPYLIGRLPRSAREAAGSARSPAPRRSLLIVGSAELSDLDSWKQSFTSLAIAAVVALGWSCDYERLPSAQAERSRASWSKVLDRHNPTHLVLLDLPPPAIRWAVKQGRPVGLVGGLVTEGASSLSVPLEPVLRVVCGRLRQLGHRRILVPLWGAPLALAQTFAHAVAPTNRMTSAACLAAGWVSAFDPGSPDRHRTQLLEAVRRLRPTALLCFNWRDYLVAQSVLAELGLRTPSDVSLVVLDSNPEMRWALPVPTHFSVGHGPFVERLVSWLRGRSLTAARASQAMLSGWVEGETLGRASPRG